MRLKKFREDVDAYIATEILSPTNHTRSATITLPPIDGVTYDGFVCNEQCTGIVTGIVTIPYMNTQKIGISNTVIGSSICASELCSIIEEHRKITQKPLPPIIAYLIAKSMTIKTGESFSINNISPSDDIMMDYLDIPDEEIIDIMGLAKHVFMEAVNNGKIPWLHKRITIGFNANPSNCNFIKTELTFS